MHPLLRLAASRPQLLAEHAAAYADLMAEEFSRSAGEWKQRLAMQLIALVGLSVAAVLVGVAVMLWAALPGGSLSTPWVLVAAPVLPALLAAWALQRCSAAGPLESFALLRRQLASDALLLRSVGEP